MSFTPQNVIDKAELILQDTGNARWSASTDLLPWAVDAEREIISRKPDAYVLTSSVVLVAGAVQAPSGAVVIFDVTRNMGTNGTTPGNAITKVEREALDKAYPGWPTETAASTVLHWMPFPDDTKRFWVYPPQPAASQGYVEIIRSALPTAPAIDGNYSIGDEYQPIIVDYILFRAFAYDAAIHPNARDRAIAHGQAFLDGLGSRESAEEFYKSHMK